MNSRHFFLSATLALMAATDFQATTLAEPPNAGANGNLLVNPNFEDGLKGWELAVFGGKGTMTIDPNELHDGKPTLRIDAPADGTLTFVRQSVTVKANTRYRLAGYIKTKDVQDLRGKKAGAVLLVGLSPYHSQAVTKTTSWAKVSVDLDTKEKTEIRVGSTVGIYANYVTGTAWYSDLSLTELGPAPPSEVVANARPASSAPAKSPQAPSGGDPTTLGNLVQANRSNLVFVTGINGSGSGFIAKMGNANFLVTNAHVAAGLKGATFKTLDSTLVRTGTALIAVDHDIFRMAVAPGGKSMKLMEQVGATATIGDDIAVLGNAEGAGVVTAIKGKIIGIGPNLIEVDAPFVPGNSGSPIIHLKTGQVVGVATYAVIRKYDPLTGKPETVPLIRRFAYRLDSVKTWQPVNWGVFAAQAAEMESVEKLTDDLDAFLEDVAQHHSITPGLHTNPAIKRPIDMWTAAKERKLSASDREMIEQDFVSRLKSACLTDIAAERSRLTYDYFQRKLEEQQRYRESMAAAVENLFEKRSGN